MLQGKKIEEIYQKKTQLEHILLRPDTYIGSVECVNQSMWVLDVLTKKMVFRSINFVPGLYKIFDEILVNAADNKYRDPSMDCIKVTIDEQNECISVWNNGQGIPVVIHGDEKVYVPELIFGHLLTSSNYNDYEKKITGGRNGYGAKLCNIFSTEFVVETADLVNKKKFKQIFKHNMSEKSPPVITNNAKEEYTKISFKPDLKKFGMTSFDDDLIALFSKRVYDLAGCCKNIKVYLNDERIPIKNFKQYTELYFADPSENVCSQSTRMTPVYEAVNDRWEICVGISEGQFQHVSFVNSIYTYKGGTHVNYVADQIATSLMDVVKKKSKSSTVKPFQIKNHLWLFINCLIENPAFDSQTKENMTLRVSDFGSKCELTEDLLKRLAKIGIIDLVLDSLRQKQDKELKKTDGHKTSRLSGIPKLDDANMAGTKQGHKCTLILTEGDSAKALAVSGLSVVGRDFFGVFPLRGKLLNVREANHKQIMENAEINAVKQILGLQHGKIYTSAESLRYGHLMIMTDQDHDGSHIKGLVINFLDHFWPSLLQLPGFLVEFITPIVRATKGKQEVTFYTLPEYERWKAATQNGKGWFIKYYKGLGTSTAADAKAYFSSMKTHLKEFSKITSEERQLIDMAFNKKKADERKEWLKQYVYGTFMDHSSATIRYEDFIHKELILFSMADTIRSIPSVIDGLKPGLRKVLFACFKRKLKEEIKVAQLAGYISEHAAYHHGDASLCASIIGLAQDYVGSNNINLLVPSGQFGTRLQGGKDAASPRYVFTKLSPMTRLLFPIDDDTQLTYLNDDGQSIEPEWYVPILPMMLVNGAEGIGTGWSTSIPNFNPIHLVRYFLKKLQLSNDKIFEASTEFEHKKGDFNSILQNIALVNDTTPVQFPMQNHESTTEDSLPLDLHPWYRGFQGSMECLGFGKYRVKGIFRRIDQDTLEITELPIGTWTQSYKEFLETLVYTSGNVSNGENSSFILKDFKEYHTDTRVHFVLKFQDSSYLSALSDEDIDKKFKLSTPLSLHNMVAFDHKGKIKKYTDIGVILSEFYHVRLSFYQLRKQALVRKLLHDWKKLDYQVKFLHDILSEKLIIHNKKKTLLVQELKRMGYPVYPFIDGNSINSSSASIIKEETEVINDVKNIKSMKNSKLTNDNKLFKENKEKTLNEDTADSDTGSSGYDYLLGMSLWSLTWEKIQQFESEKASKESELTDLMKKSPKDLWMHDLNMLVTELEKFPEYNFSIKIDQSDRIESSEKPAPIPKKAKENTEKNVARLDDFFSKDSTPYCTHIENENVSKETLNDKENNYKGTSNLLKNISALLSRNKIMPSTSNLDAFNSSLEFKETNIVSLDTVTDNELPSQLSQPNKQKAPVKPKSTVTKKNVITAKKIQAPIEKSSKTKNTRQNMIISSDDENMASEPEGKIAVPKQRQLKRARITYKNDSFSSDSELSLPGDEHDIYDISSEDE